MAYTLTAGLPGAAGMKAVPLAPSPTRAEAWLLASGIAFAAAQIAVLVYFTVAVASHWPPVGAPTAERVAFYAEHWDRISVANMLLPLPTPLFLLFLGGLYAALRRAEGGAGALAATALASGAAAALVWPVGIVAGALAMDIGRQGGDPVTMQVLEGIAPLTLALAGMPRAVMLGAAAAVVLASGCAPRLLGWSGLALAAVNLAGTATLLAPEAFPLLGLGKLLFLLWIGALAGALLMRRPVREGARAQDPRLRTGGSAVDAAGDPRPRH